jgi:hypothetical protein
LNDTGNIYDPRFPQSARSLSGENASEFLHRGHGSEALDTREMSDHDQQLARDLSAVAIRQRVNSPLRRGSPDATVVEHPYYYHPLRRGSPREQEFVELSRSLFSPTGTPPLHSSQRTNLRWPS